jgi:hypothetical protein
LQDAQQRVMSVGLRRWQTRQGIDPVFMPQSVPQNSVMRQCLDKPVKPAAGGEARCDDGG